MRLDRTKDEKEPAILAVWGPKPGDGASTVAEAITQILWEKGPQMKSIIGLMDFNTRTPFMKYRLGLDKYNLLDDLLPFITAEELTPEILANYVVTVYGKERIQFVGGIKRPEFKGRYTDEHFNVLLDTAKEVFHKTIIDAGNVLDQAGTVTALKRADYILAVLHPSFVSKQCLKYGLSLFSALGIDSNKVGIVYNRYQKNDEEPLIMASGLNVEYLGTLNELGSEKNLIGCSWLIDEKKQYRVSSFRDSLSSILEACRMMPVVESKKKGKFFPDLFAKEA
jgi:Mrp family chromosome partitioning ATPase